jgi:membrane protease YdiL (CAAX protease family)
MSAVAMYLSFFFWHGYYLNEISQLSYPRTLFYFFAGVTYLFISFLTIKVYDTKFLRGMIKNIFARGLISGFIVGLLVFMVTKVTGISIGTSNTLEHLALDAMWQCVEQIIGGFVISLGTLFIFDPRLEEDQI